MPSRFVWSPAYWTFAVYPLLLALHHPAGGAMIRGVLPCPSILTQWQFLFGRFGSLPVNVLPLVFLDVLFGVEVT